MPGCDLAGLAGDALYSVSACRPLLLKGIRKELLKRKSWLLGEVLDQFREFPVLPAPEERVRVVIGVRN